MLIDEFMPAWDVVKRHEIHVRATPGPTLQAAREMDLGRDWVIGLLLRLRGFRRPRRTWANLNEAGFIHLGESDSELLVGNVGRFWKPRGELRRLPADQFSEFNEPNFAKAIWNISVADAGAGNTLLATETRIRCTDPPARRHFRLYWSVVGPFSGLIRTRALRAIRSVAEST